LSKHVLNFPFITKYSHSCLCCICSEADYVMVASFCSFWLI
jgi:hypothetical protein